MLNTQCLCNSLDRSALITDIAARLPLNANMTARLFDTHPHLFADTPFFISAEQVVQMQELIDAIEAVVKLPGYRELVLQYAPAMARNDPGYPSVFFGYDFHLSPQGPRLIEINTNAGGAMLNLLLARAQQVCCPEMQLLSMGPLPVADLESAFVEMIRDTWSTWRSARSEANPACIAIVDEQPSQQYLYPEFLLFQELFARHGLHAVIVDPSELTLRAEGLFHQTTRIDMVYNRLTDFALESPQHAALREAYAKNLVVLTPHPHAHACYADKRNLCVLSDAQQMQSLGVSAKSIAVLLAGVPRTIVVDAVHAAELWQQRRRWFFKPVAGYGGKAAYRGDKLTTRVWNEILAAHYVAQELVPPSERSVRINGAEVILKADVRNYVYRGVVQFTSARLYQGQTTNFRTPGGGFAPVFSGAYFHCVTK